MSDLGGRPPLFETAEALQKKIDEYYQHCRSKLMPADDEHLEAWDSPGEQPTVTGLALFLGFESRQSLYDYEKREGFSYTIKRAKLRVENEYEKRLVLNNPTGSIFALKNMGWTDRTEVDQKTELSGGITVRWQEPDLQHPEDKGSTGIISGIQSGLPDNS